MRESEVFPELPPGPQAVAAYRSALSPFWHPVLPAASLGSSPLGIELLGRRLVLARLEGRVVAFRDLCSHLGAALSLGTVVDGRLLRCPYHGWSFDAEGHCRAIPSRPDLPIPQATRLLGYATAEKDGMIWVCLSPPARGEIPDFPERTHPDFHVGQWREAHPWRASSPRVILSQLDDTHFRWVHPATIGSLSQVETPDHRVRRERDAVVLEFFLLQRAKAPSVALGESTEAEELPVSYEVRGGLSWVLLRKRRGAAAFAVFQAVSPVAHDLSRVFWRLARTYDRTPESDPRHDAAQEAILEEDRRIVESQRPWLLPPISSGQLRYLRPSDLPLVEYHRWMEECGIPQI